MSRAFPLRCALAGIAVLLAACDAPPPESRRLLADFLSVAEQRGSGAPARIDPATGSIAQAANTWIRWHFLLPDQARLKGRLGVSGSGDSSKAEATLYVIDSEDQWQPVFQASPDATTEMAIDVDLAAWGGRMVRITAALPAPRNTSHNDWAVSWHDLAIHSPSPVTGRDSPQLEPQRHNVLMVLFDTLRADRTQPYGSLTVKTPKMLELAATATTFTNASANASWTAPSVASLLTSTHPSVHGVAGGAGFEKLREVSKVPPGLPFLPVILKDHGYETVAILNNPIIHPAFGFGRGFETIHEYFKQRESVLEEAVLPSAQVDLVWKRFIEPALARRGERPFFVYLHEIDPHSPYDAPSAWTQMYLPDDPTPRRDFAGLGMHTRFRLEPDRLRPGFAAQVQGLYNAEVSFMDAYLGELMARLEAAGHRDDTLVVFLSDHGESLTEHERLGHGDTLYEEVLHVPLLLSLPGVVPEGRRVAAAVELVDVVPTILEILGLPQPEGIQGRSLVPLLSGDDSTPAPRPTYAQSRFEGKWMLDSVRVGSWKLIQRAGSGATEYELYDLSSDPQEANNTWSAESVVGQTLRQMLAAKIRDDAARRNDADVVDLEEVDSSIRENLRQLGYLD